MGMVYRVDFTQDGTGHIINGFPPDLDSHGLGKVFVDYPNNARIDQGLVLSTHATDNTVALRSLGLGPGGTHGARLLTFTMRIGFIPINGPMPDPSKPVPPLPSPSSTPPNRWGVGAVAEHRSPQTGLWHRTGATLNVGDTYVRLNIPKALRDDPPSPTFPYLPDRFFLATPLLDKWSWVGREVMLEQTIMRHRPPGTPGKTTLNATVRLKNPANSGSNSPGTSRDIVQHTGPVTCETIFPEAGRMT